MGRKINIDSTIFFLNELAKVGRNRWKKVRVEVIHLAEACDFWDDRELCVVRFWCWRSLGYRGMGMGWACQMRKMSHAEGNLINRVTNFKLIQW